MAQRDLINYWLEEAEDNSSTEAGKIGYLKGKRADYSAAIEGGDFESTGISDEGSASSWKRGISALDHRNAIRGALRQLGATDVGEKPGILIPTFSGGLN